MSANYFDYSIGIAAVDVAKGPAMGRRTTGLSWRWA